MLQKANYTSQTIFFLWINILMGSYDAILKVHYLVYFSFLFTLNSDTDIGWHFDTHHKTKAPVLEILLRN